MPKNRPYGSVQEMPLHPNPHELLAFLHPELDSRYSSLIQRTSNILLSSTSIFVRWGEYSYDDEDRDTLMKLRRYFAHIIDESMRDIFFPSIVVILAMLGLNSFGDSLRDISDPRLRGGM